ncbi:reverse transcriptase domain-containing protein [Tanacetum coccineum]
MLERLCGNEYYYFLNGFSEFFQILIALEDQEKTTFTCPYETFSYRRMLFGLCNAPATFQRCMALFFHDMVEDFMEVFMDNFLGKRRVVLGHKIYGAGIQVDKAKIDVIAKLPYPINVKRAFNILKEKLTTAPIIISPDWNVPFGLMCDASDFAVGAGLTSRLRIKGAENLAADYLSRLENPDLGAFIEEEIADEFPDEHLMILKTELIDDEPTTYKTPTGCTPIRLVYGKACHLPMEIKHKAYWALKQCNMDLTTAAKKCFLELNELMELRDGAYKNTRIYMERTKRWDDSKL